MSWSEVAEPRPAHRPGRPRRRSTDGQLLGMLLLGFGVAALLRETGVWRIKWEAILAGLLIVLGVGLVATARSGRRIWPIALGVLLILTLSAHSPSLHFDLTPGSALGDRVVLVQEIAQLQDSYNHGLGDLTVDLHQVAFEPGTTRQLSINQGLGDVRILLPAGVGVELDTNVGIGKATVLGKRLGKGLGVRAHYQTPGYSAPDHARVSIQAHIGIGQVEVR